MNQNQGKLMLTHTSCITFVNYSFALGHQLKHMSATFVTNTSSSLAWPWRETAKARNQQEEIKKCIQACWACEKPERAREEPHQGAHTQEVQNHHLFSFLIYHFRKIL